MTKKPVIVGNPKWPASNIEWRQTHSLLAYQRNSRIHSDEQVDQIAASMKEFGWTIPMLVDDSGIIIAGHGRALAAAKLGISEVPVMVAKGWTEAQKMAYRIADNRLAESASWDTDMLRLELTELGKMDFDLALTGFDDLELVQFMATPNVADPEETPEPPVNPVSRKGDLWLLGNHRLLCGDAMVKSDVANLMQGRNADLCFTSPPYLNQRDYGEAKDFLSDWDALMQGVFENILLSPKGQILVNIGMVHKDGEWSPYWENWVEWMRGEGWRRFGWYVWDQGPGLPGDWNGRLAPSHEFIFHFNKSAVRARKTKEKLPESIQFNDHGNGMRMQDGSMSGVSSPHLSLQTHKVPDSVIRVMRHKARGIEVTHPAVFPVALATEIITAFSDKGALCYEPLSGSGSQILAAEMNARYCCAMEIEPSYVDVSVQRWQTYTNQDATLESTGETYAEVAHKRLHSAQKPPKAPNPPKPRKRTSKPAVAAE